MKPPFDKSVSEKKKVLPPGKISPNLLEKLFSTLTLDSRVIVGPGLGQDAAVVEQKDRYLVIKTDPITLSQENIGWCLVNINANDIACMGAYPRWFLATVLLPEKATSSRLVEEIFGEITSACGQLNVSLIGGHCEVTPGLRRPIAVGQMIGEVAKEKLVTGSGAEVGDLIILTKGLAIEGTQVIYQKKKDELREKLPAGLLRRISRFLYQPGISIVKEALLAAGRIKVHAMHDPTEGGLRAGLWELARASNVRMEVEKGRIPLLEETVRVCRLFNLDPLGLLASGCLILIIPPSEEEELSCLYQKEGISWAKIGQVVTGFKGVALRDGKRVREISGPFTDELHKI